YFSLPRLSGPYALMGGIYLLSALLVFLTLRPDPLHIVHEEKRQREDDHPETQSKKLTVPGSLTLIRRYPAATCGLAAMILGQMVMTGVMSMTPLHLEHGGQSL